MTEHVSFPIDHPERKTLSIIIPAYNEEAGIGDTLRALCDEEYLREAEIIVLDDGSTDATPRIAGQFPRVRLVSHMINRGYGSAIATAARVAGGEYILWFDADGQHRVQDLVEVCRKMTDGQLEYCIGIRDQNSYHDPDRKLGKWLLRLAVNFSVGREVPDFNSGLRGFRRDILLRYLHLLPRGFGASTLTTLLMIEGNHYGTTVPITVKMRVGKSTVRQFKDGLRTLQIILHIVLLLKPLQFFGTMGAFFILTGTLYGLLKASINQLGFPIFASLLIILGVQSFFFGLIGDQIGAMRRERFG